MQGKIGPERPKDYHDLVARTLAEHAAGPDDLGSLDAAIGALAAGLEPQFAALLERSARADVEAMLATFPAHGPNGAIRAVVEAVLYQAIESAWHSGRPTFPDERSLRGAEGLADFRSAVERPAFSYILLRESFWTRAPNAAARRFRMLLNLPGRNTMGLKVTRCPRATLDYLNSLCARVGSALGLSRPFPLMVTSVLRTRDHQRHLARIGYLATPRSGHLAGYAADLEQAWYRDNHPRAHAAARAELERDFAAGRINLMDYGGFWHLCLSPASIAASGAT